MPQMELDFSQTNSDSSTSPMAALLIVIGEAVSEDHKNLILGDLTKGLRCLNLDDVGVDINEELAKVANRAETGEEGPDDERVIQYTSDKFAVEILLNPHLQTLQQAIKNFLSTATSVRHLLFAGQYFAGNGSWILQDDTFTVANLAHVFKGAEEDIKQQDGSRFSMFCSSDGEWKSATIAKFNACKNWKVEVNPAECLNNVNGILQFTAYVSNFLRTKTVTELLRTSDVVGNIRFSKPTLYIFPGSEGDSSLFGISGFNLLVNGGFKRRSCFWDFCRHLDRIDAVLMTHLGTDNVFGVSAMLQRKSMDEIHPEIGYVYLNAGDKTLHSSVNDNKKPSLSVSLADEGNRIIEYSKQLGLVPHPCTRNATSKDVHPINLYHKVGHGSLDMYILNPVTDSKELKDFYQQWNKQVADFGSLQNVSLPNMLSVCSLLVWKPANPAEKICRIFFPGNAPQHKVFEGLDKLKQLEVLKHSNCTGQSLLQSKTSPKKATSGSARPASARPDRSTKPTPSSATQRKVETKESTKPQKQRTPATQKPTKVSKEDENKMKAEDKGSKSKANTSPTKPSPTKTTKSSTPKKTSPVEKTVPVVNSEPEKAVKEETKTEKPNVEDIVKPNIEEVKAPVAPPQQPIIDLLSMEEEKVAAAVKAAEEALQQTTEPSTTSEDKSESPEPLPDPNQYNEKNVKKEEPTEIIPQDQFQSSMDDFGFQSQKFDSVVPNGGTSAEPALGFEENHIDDSEDVKPESLPEPVAYSPHEPDVIPEADTFKETSMQESMMTSSMIQPEPDVVQSVQNESDFSSTDSALVSTPKDEDLQNFEEDEAAINARLASDETGVCENVVNGVLDNLDDDGIMYDDEEVEDELDKDAETEKDLMPCDEMPKTEYEEQSVDLLQHESAKQEQELSDEFPVKSSQVELQEPLFDKIESAKVDLLPPEIPDVHDVSATSEKQEEEVLDELEETESEQPQHISETQTQEKEDAEDIEFEKTDPFATPEFEKDWVVSEKSKGLLPDEPEKTVDATATDVLESKDDEEEQEDELSPDEGDSQTGGPRDSISPELDVQTKAARDSISPEPDVQTGAAEDRISPELDDQTRAADDSISPELDVQTEAARDSISPELDVQTRAAEDISPELDVQTETARDSISPEPYVQTEPPRDGISPELDVQKGAAQDNISPELDIQTETARDSMSPELDVQKGMARDSISPELDVQTELLKDSISPELDVQKEVLRDSISPELGVHPETDGDAPSSNQIEPATADNLMNAFESQEFREEDDRTSDLTASGIQEADSALMHEETKSEKQEGNNLEKEEDSDEDLLIEDDKIAVTPPEEELKEYEGQVLEEMQNLQEPDGDLLEVSNIPEAFEKDETPDPKDLPSNKQDLEEHVSAGEVEQQDSDKMDSDSDFDENEDEDEMSENQVDTSPDSDVIIDHQIGANAGYNPFSDVSQPQTNGTDPAYNPFEGLDRGMADQNLAEHTSVEPNRGQQLLQGQQFYGHDSERERAPQMYGVAPEMEQEAYEMGLEAFGGQTYYGKGMEPESHQQEDPEQQEPWDPETEWGKPMGLPSPPPPEDTPTSNAVKQNGKSPASKSSPKSKSATKTTDSKRPDSARSTTKVGTEKRTTSATNRGPPNTKSTETKTRTSGLNTSRTESKSNTTKRPVSASVSEPKTKSTGSRRPATATGNSRTSPMVAKMPPLPPFTTFYVDLTYIPNHGDPHYSNVEFFKRMRARYYVLSSLSPNIKSLDALLDAKETWEDTELPVTIIPTYDNEMLRHWMGLNKDRLSNLNIDMAPSASRCTIQLQDHETSCSAYRLEF